MIQDIEAIIPFLTDELRRPPWKGCENPLAGHCYVASEVAFHLLPAGWKPMFIRHEGSPHWFLQHESGEILDLTAQQFETPVPYHLGIGKGFLTKAPSQRAQIILCKMSSMRAKLRNLRSIPEPKVTRKKGLKKPVKKAKAKTKAKTWNLEEERARAQESLARVARRVMWTTGDGRSVVISEMSDDHLLSTERLIREGNVNHTPQQARAMSREVRERGLTPLSPRSDDHASCDMAISRLHRLYPNLEASEQQAVMAAVQEWMTRMASHQRIERLTPTGRPSRRRSGLQQVESLRRAGVITE